ncbi:MAG: ATP-binding protein, partial [Tepidiforma sp.]
FLADCRALFGAEFGFVFAFEPGQPAARRLALDSSRPLPMDAFAEEVPVGRLRGAALQHTPAPQVVPDAREETPLHPGHRALLEAGLLSVIRVPLVVHESVRGSVALWGEGTDRFTAEDAELLGTLARPLALALEKASALESLAESELKYRSLVAQAEEMILTVDAESRRILDANPFAARVLGYAQRELHGLRLDDISMADEAELASFMARIHADGEVHLADVRYRKRDGSPLDVEVVASLVAYGGREAVLVLARDVSERKALMAQLMQSQKMESLGTMAGAVAHDFNNLLTVINGNCQLALMQTGAEHPARGRIEAALAAGSRASDLTRQLLAFSQRQPVQPERLDIAEALTGMEPVLRSLLGDNCRLHLRIEPGLGQVRLDPSQFQQVILNLCVNARDAMQGQGEIEIRAAGEGDGIVIEVSDTGPGVPAEIREQIFEPFFTTKPKGQGTGLGLAVVYGIVTQNNGSIEVKSEPGKGACFRIEWPSAGALEVRSSEGTAAAEEGALEAEVLVVEDQAEVRRFVVEVLRAAGCRVHEAGDAESALRLAAAHPGVRLLLTDVSMPGMDGDELANELKQRFPQVQVLLMSGYPRRGDALGWPVLPKPFTPEKLTEEVRRLLARTV